MLDTTADVDSLLKPSSNIFCMISSDGKNSLFIRKKKILNVSFQVRLNSETICLNLNQDVK